MPPAAAGSFVVLLAGAEDLENRALADVVARARGVPRIDAARLARRARGILGEGLSEAEAAGLARSLLDEGIAAVAVPDHRLAVLPPALSFTGVEPAGESLVLHEPVGSHAIPWSRVRMLAGGNVRHDVPEMVEEPGTPSTGAIWLGASLGFAGTVTGAAFGVPVHLDPLAFMPKPPMVERLTLRAEERLVLDVLLRDPPERFRGDALTLDYSGLGKRMDYASFANLRTLAEMLREGAPGAARGPGVEAILKVRGPVSPRYDSFEDLEREERWLATVAPA